MSFEIEEVDDEELTVGEVINLDQYKYDEFWSDPCWRECPGPLG